MAAKTRKMAVQSDVGALVFVFAQMDGQFGIVSTDRKVEAWGQSLDDCWPKYFTKASRAMKKRDREIAAAAKADAAKVADGWKQVTPSATNSDTEGEFTEV
jgi:hypothetical protein